MLYTQEEYKAMCREFIEELFNARNYVEVIQWMYLTFGVEDSRWIEDFGFNRDEVLATIEELKEEGDIV